MKITLKNRLISEIGSREKYIRANHYNTLKVWWARRPITAARSLIIKEILKRRANENDLVDVKLFSDLNPSQKTFKDFQTQYSTSELTLLDVFSGGGSIPFESARLGLETYSAELNPVATLLQETIFDSQGIENYSALLKNSGDRVINKLQKRIEKFFDINGIKPYVIYWAKVAKCKSCNIDLDLRRFEYFSKRIKKPIRLFEQNDELIIDNSFSESLDSSKGFLCKSCNTINTFKDIKEFCKTNSFYHSAFAICHLDKKKKYKILNPEEKLILSSYEEEIDGLLQKLDYLIPKEIVKSKNGVINPTIYDLKTPKDFFSKRQLLVLLTLIDELVSEYPILLEDHGELIAKQITLGLTSLIEFLVDWNSVSTMWIPQNEQTGRSLAGPGVGMKWDYIEINPFSGNGSNLRSKLYRVCDTFNSIRFNNKVKIIKGSSTQLPLENNSIDIILTDPPYYDSIDYTGLSDFFRPWFERLIQNTYDPYCDLKNQDDLEAIVELSKGDNLKDHHHYKKIMSQVFLECNRVLKEDGSMLLMYSHKTIEGWEVIAEAFKESKLFISECIPLEMERSARPRAMAHEALNGVIVFKATKNKVEITSVENDIDSIYDKIKTGEMYESQVVIYLAGLACKQVSLKDKTYNECYTEVTRLYQLNLIEKWMREDMDIVTIAYLEARLKDNLSGLNESYIETLTKFDLTIKDRVKNLDETEFGNTLSSTLLGQAQIIYNDFKNNSKSKVIVDIRKKESITVFFSILAGTQLNSVSKRSNTSETKTARLVLSKLVG